MYLQSPQSKTIYQYEPTPKQRGVDRVDDSNYTLPMRKQLLADVGRYLKILKE